MLRVVLAMVFSGAVGDGLSECAGIASNIGIRQAQCHERMQAGAWPRGLLLEATLSLVRRLSAPMSVQAWPRGVILEATLPLVRRLF